MQSPELRDHSLTESSLTEAINSPFGFQQTEFTSEECPWQIKKQTKPWDIRTVLHRWGLTSYVDELVCKIYIIFGVIYLKQVDASVIIIIINWHSAFRSCSKHLSKSWLEPNLRASTLSMEKNSKRLENKSFKLGEKMPYESSGSLPL